MDFKVVLDTLIAVHGEAMTFIGDGSLDHGFEGVFDENYVSSDPQTGQLVTSEEPSILVRLGDLPSRPKMDDRFMIRESEFAVRAVEPDGKGGARIFLREV